jgi:aminoglycoside phosphotransferase (APT) family kinase protein
VFSRSDIPPALARWVPGTSRLVFPPQGMTAEVAFVEPGDVVLKRCVDPLYLDWLRRERVVLAALEGTSVAPRALDALDRGTDVWLVMSRLPGISAAHRLRQARARDRAALLERIGAFLARLHAVPVPPALREPRPWIARKLDEARANLGWCDGSPDLLERLRATRPAPVEETLIHGDLTLENVLVDGDRVAGLVDWPAGGPGDPRCDVALALQADADLGITEMEEAAFFRGFGRAIDADTRRWFEDLYEFF